MSWKCCKQGCVGLSTAEAEYMALSSAAQEAIWMRQLLSELKGESLKPATIFEEISLPFVCQKTLNFMAAVNI